MPRVSARRNDLASQGTIDTVGSLTTELILSDTKSFVKSTLPSHSQMRSSVIELDGKNYIAPVPHIQAFQETLSSRLGPKGKVRTSQGGPRYTANRAVSNVLGLEGGRKYGSRDPTYSRRFYSDDYEVNAKGYKPKVIIMELKFVSPVAWPGGGTRTVSVNSHGEIMQDALPSQTVDASSTSQSV